MYVGEGTKNVRFFRQLGTRKSGAILFQFRRELFLGVFCSKSY